MSDPAASPPGALAKRRVLHVLNGLDRGGIELWMLEILRRLDTARYQLDVLVLTADPGSEAAVVRQFGGEVFTCSRPGNPLALAREFATIVRTRGPYTIVHTHVHHYSGLIVSLAVRHRIPIRIVQSHNDTRPQEAGAGWRRRLYLAAMKGVIRRLASSRVAVSREAAADLFGRDWQKNGATLLYCGIDFARFAEVGRREALLEALGFPEDALVIGHVGRFFWRKNHAFLLEIAAAAFAREPRARLLLLGDGPLADEMRQRAAALGIADRVCFAGARRDVPLLMTTVIDVCVLPSHHEGLSLAALEAQAAGLPLVLSEGLTREGDVVPELISRLPLEAGAEAWAARLCGSAAAGRPLSRSEALARMSASPFAIDRSVERVLALYERG